MLCLTRKVIEELELEQSRASLWDWNALVLARPRELKVADVQPLARCECTHAFNKRFVRPVRPGEYMIGCTPKYAEVWR